MKKTPTYLWSLWLTAALTVLLAACSADDGLTPGAAARHDMDSVYVNLRIVSGTAAPTRAADAADAAEQATQAERQIYDGILCIFVGASEATAELKAACAIDQRIDAAASATDNTAETTVIQRLPSEKLDLSTYAYGTDNLYALLLLNVSHTGLTVSSGTLNHNGAAIPDKYVDGKITVADLQQLELSSLGCIDATTSTPYADPSFHTGLFMSNAPQSASSVLTAISNSSLYASWDGASAGTATTIHVERAAAKVMVSSASPEISFRLDGTGTAAFHKMTWMPDQTAQTYYAVRNTAGWTWGDFTYDTGFLHNGNWACSPNYYGTKTLSTINGRDFSVYQQHALKDGGVAYVMENTTDKENASPAHLTRVVIEVQVKDASNMLLGDCFTFNDVRTTLYTGTTTLVGAMKTWWTENRNSADYPDLYTKTADEVLLTPKLTVNADCSVTLTLENSAFNASERADLHKLANDLSSRTTAYREGRMYYSAIIQHTTGSPSATAPYALGDYGVVRSNYYKLTLGNISTVGSPTPDMPAVVPITLRPYVVEWKDGGSYQLEPK